MIKEKIVLLNVLKYSNDRGEGTRIGFIFADESKKVTTDKFIGYSEISQFYNSSVFDKFNSDLIGKPITATFKTEQNPANPLRTRTLISSLEYNGRTINLL